MNKKMNLFAGKFVSAALAVMLLFYTALSVTSCVQPTGNKKDGNGFKSKSTQELLAELHGSWRSTYKEDYRINKKDSFFVSAGEDYQTHQPTVFYSGKIEKIVAVSETEGTIFIKFEKPGFGANKGEYYAIHYQRLEKEKKVGISGAYKAGGKSSTLTLQEAEKEFTVENGYFGVHSECTWHKLEEIAPAQVNYTVHHQKQKGTEWEDFDTETLQGVPGQQTNAQPKPLTGELEGYTVLQFNQETINSNGTTKVFIKYQKNAKTITVTMSDDDFGYVLRTDLKTEFFAGTVYEFKAAAKEPVYYTADSWNITGGEFVENTGNAGDVTVKAKFTGNGSITATFKIKNGVKTAAITIQQPQNGAISVVRELNGKPVTDLSKAIAGVRYNAELKPNSGFYAKSLDVGGTKITELMTDGTISHTFTLAETGVNISGEITNQAPPPAQVNYTVHHQKQKVTEWEDFDTETLQGIPGQQTNAQPKPLTGELEGYTVLPFDQVPIDSKGTTNVFIKYQKNAATVTVTLYEDEFGKVKRINPESSVNTFEVGKVYEFEAEIKNTEYEPDVWTITGGEFVENTGNKGDKKVKAKFTADGELKVTFKQKTPPVTEETVPEQYRGKWKATSSFYLFEEKSISVLKANSQVDTKGSLVSKSIEADGKSGWFVIKIEETTDSKYKVGHYIKIAFKEFTPAQMKIGRQRNSFATAEEAAKEATADVRIPYKKV